MNSLFATLLHALDRSDVSDIARALGESEQSVSRGMECSVATVLGGLASKSGDPGTLRKILDLLPANSGDISLSQFAGSLSNSDSPLIAGGKQMLSGLFGTGDAVIMNTVGKECGLRPRTASTLLAMAAPMVISFVSNRVRNEGLSMTGLGNVLQRESATIRNALPAGLSELIWPDAPVAAAHYPVVTPSVNRKRGFPSWATGLALGALALGCFWLVNQTRRPAAEIGSGTTGTASRMANEALGSFVRRKLPNDVEINVPDNGVESQLLVFIKDPTATVDRASCFDCDRLLFDSGSANLQPESREQLDNIAAILKAYPNVRVAIDGHSDSLGNAQRNLELSRDRARNVRTALTARGVSADRLTAGGFGEQNAATENSAEGERLRNRRVCLRVTQK